MPPSSDLNFRILRCSALTAFPYTAGVFEFSNLFRVGLVFTHFTGHAPRIISSAKTKTPPRYCRDNNITYQAYSPLGGLDGLNILNDTDVKSIASAHSVSAAQVALRWVAQAGAVIVTAAEKEEYMKEDLDIFGFELSDAEFALLAAK